MSVLGKLHKRLPGSKQTKGDENMPFGFFGINEEKKKKERKTRVKDNVNRWDKVRPTPPPPTPPPGPKFEEYVGVHIDKEPVKRYEPPKNTFETQKVARPPIPEWHVNPDSTIPILLIGETHELIADFLCSMQENLNETLPQGGIAYYTDNNDTISRMAKVKKGISACFGGDPSLRWPEYGDDSNEPRIYSFSISKAGNPQNAIALNFMAVTPYSNGAAALAGRAAAVWILVPGNAESNPETEYEEMVKHILLSMGDAVKARNVEIIISQFEHMGLFRDSGSIAELPGNLKDELYTACRSRYEEIFVQLGAKARVCAAQIYGGLEFYERNESGKPVYYVNIEGRCAGYAPVACHIPLLHLFTALRGSAGCLREPAGENIWLGVQSGFSDYIGRKQWDPQTIG